MTASRSSRPRLLHKTALVLKFELLQVMHEELPDWMRATLSQRFLKLHARMWNEARGLRLLDFRIWEARR